MTALVDIGELSSLAGVSRQAIEKAVARISKQPDALWRGCRLGVVTKRGRGGRSGRSYLIRVDSLPEPLQAAFKALGKPVQLALPLRRDDAASAERRQRLAIIGPIVAHPAGSAERRAALRTVVATPVFRHGKHGTLPERTIRNWVLAFDRGGEAALQPKERKDKGARKVKLSRPWDRLTADLPEEQRAALVSATDRHVKSLWGNGAVYSVVRRLSAEKLADRTRNAGIDRPAAELVKLCTLPKHYLEHWSRRDLRRVHEHNTDAKSYDDSRSRVKLTSVDEQPMSLVFGDVHHFNVLLYREDGTVATPKGIAWLDAANRRVRIDLVLCEPGTAIRNEDLILSFVKMTQDPQWGLPKRLYLDNGSEYQFAELLEAALKLTRLGCDVAEWNSPVTRARPHNAAAKGILEGTFRIINQKCIQPMKGSIHDDRMRKKSASLGKATVPHGYFDAFAKLFEGSLLYFNQDPQKGELGGLSPLEKFTEQVKAGWKRTAIEESSAWMLFSEPSTAMVTKGGISVDGIRYYHDDLFRFSGRKLPIQVPRYLVWRAIPVFTPEGNPLCVAHEEVTFDRMDRAGAVESGRREAANRSTIATMAAEIDPLDVPAEMVASAGRQPKAPTPEVDSTVRIIGPSGSVGGKARRGSPKREKSVNQADQDALRRRLAILGTTGAG